MDDDIEVGCEILSMEFFEESAGKRLLIVLGTAVGICVADVRTRELVAAVASDAISSQKYVPNGGLSLNFGIRHFTATNMIQSVLRAFTNVTKHKSLSTYGPNHLNRI